MREPFLGASHRQHLDAAGSVDFAVVRAGGAQGDGRRFRANLFRHERGLALALRSIWTEVPTLEQLHLPDSLSEQTRHRTGLVLVAGATGAGKSATLSALLEQVNRTRPCPTSSPSRYRSSICTLAAGRSCTCSA